MDSMLSAIKAKRQGLGGAAVDEKTMLNQSPEQEGSGLQGLIEQLSPDQKMELMQLLQQDQSNSSEDIESGAPSKNEQKIVEAKAAQEQSIGEMPEEESDAIAMSMIDRNSLQKAEAGVKPRGLGDRAKMAMAQNLKGKGKLK